ncbi:Ran GTPase-activating protein 1 [Manis javanica]|nr:Ran GTPase-activating protein 1 [Manis javanica]
MIEENRYGCQPVVQDLRTAPQKKASDMHYDPDVCYDSALLPGGRFDSSLRQRVPFCPRSRGLSRGVGALQPPEPFTQPGSPDLVLTGVPTAQALSILSTPPPPKLLRSNLRSYSDTDDPVTLSPRIR